LKPSNLMIGGNQQVRILDFGIGSLLAETEGESLVDTMSTASSLASGLDCASPESIMDPTNLTPLGDQYGLGCVLYYCLAGQFPFPDGTAAEKMMAHQFKQPKPIRELVPDLPEGLVSIVERLMQKAPEARYGSSSEVIDALRPFVKAPLTSSFSTAPAVAQPSSNPPEKTRPQPPIMDDTPRPALRAPESQPPPARSAPPPPRSAASAPVLPSRQSLSRAGGDSARKAEVRPASPPAVPASVPRPTLLPKTDASEPVRPRLVAGEPPNPVPQAWPQVSWEERLGPVGIVVSALVVCALAWLITWKLF
jgi:serine/threonine-protein kinase